MKAFVRGRAGGLWTLLLALGCGGHAGEGVLIGGETNWLATCNTDSDCSVGACLCNVCTISCAEDAACGNGPPGSSCVAQSELPSGCGQTLSAGLCLAGDAQVGAVTSSAELPAPVTPLDASLALFLQDLEAQPAEAQRFTRYLSLANIGGARGLVDLEPEYGVDGARARELRLSRGLQATTRMLNQLSLQPEIAVPVTVDAEGQYLRIDLRVYGWERPVAVGGVEHADAWEAIAARSSLALEYRGRSADQLSELSDSRFPWLFADDLIVTGLRGDLYAALLRLPPGLEELRATLDDGVPGASLVQRAAFENSGASFHARVTERRSFEHGRAYWQSFDFGDEARGSAVFANPLAFAAEQTEVIFPMPNGLSGFFLAGSNGQRLEASDLPRTAVMDAAQRDGVLRSPESCFNCHDEGLVSFSDAMHDVWFAATDETVERLQVLDLYPPSDVLDAAVKADNLAQASLRAEFGMTGPSNVSRLAWLFSGQVDRERAAQELLTTTEGLASFVAQLPGPLFPLIVAEGEVARGEFGTAYRDAMCTLHATSQNQPVGCH